MNDLLVQLDKHASNSNTKWVARWSSTGRGFRLHQTFNWENDFFRGEAIGDTPREALEKFMSNTFGIPS